MHILQVVVGSVFALAGATIAFGPELLGWFRRRTGRGERSLPELA